jgi:AI-2E family transporter
VSWSVPVSCPFPATIIRRWCRSAAVTLAGRRGFAALVSYVRATAAVALVDAIGIGIGLAIIGVPLVIPLSALVLLTAFVPIIGAILAGAVAVLNASMRSLLHEEEHTEPENVDVLHDNRPPRDRLNQSHLFHRD